jgi:hypothetical protein
MEYIPNPDNRKEHNMILDIYAEEYLPDNYPDADFSERNKSPTQRPSRNNVENPLKPDIVGRDSNDNIVVKVEIETPGLVTMRHAKGHWDKYADLDGDFHLIVPLDNLERALQILTNLGIEEITVLRGYKWKRNKLVIYEPDE